MCQKLSSPDDTSVDQFLDLSSDNRILHMILQCLRIGLSLLQDLLHDWVIHDSLRDSVIIYLSGDLDTGKTYSNFWVAHCPL